MKSIFRKVYIVPHTIIVKGFKKGKWKLNLNLITS